MHVSLNCLAAAAAACGHVVLVICMVDSWAVGAVRVRASRVCVVFFLLNSNSYNCIYHYQYSQSCAVFGCVGVVESELGCCLVTIGIMYWH